MNKKNEEEYEKQKINFEIKLVLNKNKQFELQYFGKTPNDQLKIDINQYGSGARNIEPKTGGIFKKINSINNFFKTITLPNELVE
jgi:hypothetical protein